MGENLSQDNSLRCLMPALLGRFRNRHGRVPMALAIVAGVDRCRWISKGQLWPNCPETRANAGAWQVDGKSDGKNASGSGKYFENQQLERIVDDRVGVSRQAQATAGKVWQRQAIRYTNSPGISSGRALTNT
jgi:hypothetical protein